MNTGLNDATSKSVNQVYAKNGQLYASTSRGLFRSPVGAVSWQPVSQEAGVRRLNQGGAQAVIVNTDGSIIAAVAGANPNGIFYSTDNGARWDRAGGLPPVQSVFYMTAHPTGTPLYAAADDGIYMSVNFGRNWFLNSDGVPPGETTLRVAVSPDDPTRLYASTSSSVYVSKNSGVSWSEAAGTSGEDPADAAPDNKTLLPAGGKRAFIVAPSIQGMFGVGRALVGTETGVWATLDDGETWKHMSYTATDPANGNTLKRVIWSLGLGFSTPTIMTGTQGFGVYNTAPQPIQNDAAPVVTGPSQDLRAGMKLQLTVPATWWKGTSPFFTTYQWKSCSSANVSSCTTSIAGATSPSYVIPDSDIGTTKRYAVTITGKNIVSPNPISQTSNVFGDGTAIAAPANATTPFPTVNPVISPNDKSYEWGKTFTVSNGTWTFNGNPITPLTTYQWRRCDHTGNNCVDIVGADEPSYTTTKLEMDKKLEAFVTATHMGANNSRPAALNFTIIQKTPVNTVKPLVTGEPYIGRKLSSSVGGWTGDQISYTRRWFRCEADGLGCNPVSGQTASTYDVTEADRGKRLQIEVTATSPDPLFVPREKKEFSEAGAVITDPPPPPVDPPPPPPGPNPNDPNNPNNPNNPRHPANKPVLSKVSLAAKRFRIGAKRTSLTGFLASRRSPVGTTFRFTLNRPATMKITIERALAGKRRGRRCVAPTRRNRRAKKCTRYIRKGVITRVARTRGAKKIAFSGRLGRKRLALGKYRATFSARNLAGAAKMVRVTFSVVRR